MNNDIVAYASVFDLSRSDMQILKIKDAYSVHKAVYGLFSDIRSEAEKHASSSSGIVYADIGGDFNSRQILMLSNRLPHQTPQFGQVRSKPILASFLTHERYAFEVRINPAKRDKTAGKVLAIRGRDEIAAWFISRAPHFWGFTVNATSFQVDQMGVQSFEKNGEKITHGSATLRGELLVTDQARFNLSFSRGIGRGRAFGFGLLRVVPL